MFTLRAMKTYPSAQTLGFFDVETARAMVGSEEQPVKPVGCGDRLGGFPPAIGAGPGQTGQGPGGRPANDPVKMFKLLVVQRYYYLSDEPTEYQVSGRLSFQKFAGWTVVPQGGMPDANTEKPNCNQGKRR